MVWSLVPCSEEHGAISESFGLEQSSATVTLRCDWVNRYLLVADILGRVHPFAAGLRARSVTLEDDGAKGIASAPGSQHLVYEHSLATVQYSSDVTADLVTEDLEPAVEFLTQDWRDFRWGAADGKPLAEDEAPGKQYRTMRIVRTEHLVSSIHPDHFNLFGHTNQNAYTSARLGFTFPADTLLYEPPRSTFVTASDGSLRVSLTKSFMFNPQTWNKFWRAETKDWEEIFVVGAARHLNYPMSNFNNILF